MLNKLSKLNNLYKDSPKFIFGISLLVLLFCTQSCRPVAYDKVCIEFYKKNRSEEEFLKYDLDSQLKILQCDIDTPEGNSGRSIAIAKQGEKIIKPLFSKLVQDNLSSGYEEDRERVVILMVLESLAIKKILNQENFDNNLLEESVKKIESTRLKSEAQNSLTKIKEYISENR